LKETTTLRLPRLQGNRGRLDLLLHSFKTAKVLSPCSSDSLPEAKNLFMLL
jgi:hypothetical protein